MNKQEAEKILDDYEQTLRRRSYSELLKLMNHCCEHTETQGPSGAKYFVDVQAFWDDKKDENIRVGIALDDGGWRSYLPVTRDFIMAPDGSFVGENVEARHTLRIPKPFVITDVLVGFLLVLLLLLIYLAIGILF